MDEDDELEYGVIEHSAEQPERTMVFTTGDRAYAVAMLDEPDVVEVLQRRVGPWEPLTDQ